MNLTKPMREALDIAVHHGSVVAGYDEIKGRRVKTNARTLDAMARRGLLTLHLSTEGGMMGRPTEAARRLLGHQ